MRENHDSVKFKKINGIMITGFLGYVEELAKKRGAKKSSDNSYISRETKKTYLRGVKGFFKFIGNNNDKKVGFERVFSDINIPNGGSDTEPEHLTDKEIDRLLNYIDRVRDSKKTYNAYRNSLLIKLMLSSGLRISEALGVCLVDFMHIEEKEIYRIKIKGKGGMTQYAYIPCKDIEVEMRYFLGSSRINASDYIMIASTGEKLNRSNSYRMLNLIYKKALISKRGQHLLRHSAAMYHLRSGTPITTIQKILRHKTIVSTNIYARATEDEIGIAMNG